MKKTIWFDITNVPHVNFLLPIVEHYKDDFNYLFSIRDFAETKALFEKKIGREYFEIGKHHGKNKFKKVFGMLQRTKELSKLIPDFDVAISLGGMSPNFIAKHRKKRAVTFDDNEKSANWIYAPFSDLAFWPNVISRDALLHQHFKEESIYQYNGYKEEFYLADYKPDESFLKSLPFDKYVVVRAENMKASYVSGTQTVVPELVKLLNEAGVNVLFLPRYESDREYAKNFGNVFIPDGAVNGLDACYFSDAVLTGAGTMAREAACLGIPAVSFYAGSDLLTVDKSLVDAGKMFFSRNPENIMNFLKDSKRGSANLQHCKSVQNEIFEQLDNVLYNL